MNIGNLAPTLPVSIVIGVLIIAACLWGVLQLVADKRYERENQPKILQELDDSRRRRRAATGEEDEQVGIDVSDLSGMERKLAQAGIAMKPVTFLALVIFGALALFAIGLMFSGTTAAIILAGVELVAVRLVVNNRANKRIELFEKQLTQAEMQIAENLRSGLSVARSLRTVSELTQDPLKRQFEAVYNEITYSSATLPEALSNMARRTANKDVELLSTVIKVQDETGSDLSDSMEFLSDTLAKRTEMRNSVKVALAETKLTIKICAAMPAVAFVLVYFFYDGYAEFYQSEVGTIMIVVIAIIEMFALWFLGRMANIKLD